MIRVKGLTKAYGDAVVVDDVSFDVASGEAVALWGHNGAGKTTIVRCLFGLVSYRGEVTVGGHDARRDGKEARRLMGHVPQELSFFDVKLANKAKDQGILAQQQYEEQKNAGPRF